MSGGYLKTMNLHTSDIWVNYISMAICNIVAQLVEQFPSRNGLLVQFQSIKPFESLKIKSAKLKVYMFKVYNVTSLNHYKLKAVLNPCIKVLRVCVITLWLPHGWIVTSFYSYSVGIK